MKVEDKNNYENMKILWTCGISVKDGVGSEKLNRLSIENLTIVSAIQNKQRLLLEMLLKMCSNIFCGMYLQQNLNFICMHAMLN